MNRRGFLGACIATLAAPAIVRASSLMPAVDPRARALRQLAAAYGGGFTADCWANPQADGQWHHYAVGVDLGAPGRDFSSVVAYVDGVLVRHLDDVSPLLVGLGMHRPPRETLWLDELRMVRA